MYNVNHVNTLVIVSISNITSIITLALPKLIIYIYIYIHIYHDKLMLWEINYRKWLLNNNLHINTIKSIIVIKVYYSILIYVNQNITIYII